MWRNSLVLLTINTDEFTIITFDPYTFKVRLDWVANLKMPE